MRLTAYLCLLYGAMVASILDMTRPESWVLIGFGSAVIAMYVEPYVGELLEELKREHMK